MKREMEIEISAEGEVTIKVRGARGKECLEVSEFLESALGEVIDRQLTPDYYVQEERSQENIFHTQS